MAAVVPGRCAPDRGERGFLRAVSCAQQAGVVPMSEATASPSRKLPAFVRAVDPAVATAFACIVLLLLLGSLYSSNFLSPEYLLQQLKVASFLGVIATGMMIVILLGQIDLSVPWVVAMGGMMSSAAAAYGTAGAIFAI